MLRLLVAALVCSAFFALVFIQFPVTVTSNSSRLQALRSRHNWENTEHQQSSSSTRPVIGILTQPYLNEGSEYIAASYVKLVESSGARVVPIRFWWSEAELEEAFNGINGLVLPGGGASLDAEDSVVIRPARFLYKLAERQNRLAPNSFFIFGICQGWEIMAIVATGEDLILKKSGPYVDEGVAHSLLEVRRERSVLLRGMPPRLTNQRLFFYYHEFGVSEEMFQAKFDTECWTATAMGRDTVGKKFVAVAESRCAPYYAVQFHPEKNLFEWGTTGAGVEIPHSLAATEASLHFSRVLAKLARESRPGNFNEEEIFRRAIQNFPVTTLGDGYFFQVYEL